MSKKIEVHTLPCKGVFQERHWVNRVVGVPYIKACFYEKAIYGKRTAVRLGKLLAKSLEAEHVIHTKDGKIAEKNSYGGDSPRRKG